jgi:hypothetical protein
MEDEKTLYIENELERDFSWGFDYLHPMISDSFDTYLL